MQTTAAVRDDRQSEQLRWGTGMMILGALAVIVLGIIFFVDNFTRFYELGLGHQQVDKSEAEIKAFSPSLRDYISHLHIAVAGLLACTGLFVIALTWFGVRRRQLWAWVAAVTISTVALATVLPSHYFYDLDAFAHLGIAYVAAVVFFAGAILALAAIKAPN